MGEKKDKRRTRLKLEKDIEREKVARKKTETNKE